MWNTLFTKSLVCTASAEMKTGLFIDPSPPTKVSVLVKQLSDGFFGISWKWIASFFVKKVSCSFHYFWNTRKATAQPRSHSGFDRSTPGNENPAGKYRKGGAIPCGWDGGNDEVGQTIIVMMVCRHNLDLLYFHDDSPIVQRDGKHIRLKYKHMYLSRTLRIKTGRIFKIHLMALLKRTHGVQKIFW